jgi:hypothetical protein
LAAEANHRSELEHKLCALADVIAAEKKQHMRTAERLEAVLASSSWRYTGPIRWLKHAASRPTKGLPSLTRVPRPPHTPVR